MIEHSNIFALIAEAVKEANVRLILIGGFAVNAYNYARNTRDIDFLITDEDYKKLSSILAASGYEESVKTNVFAKQVPQNTGAMPVDFLFVTPETFELMWRSGRDTVVADAVFRLPSLLHLIALKLHAVKQGSKDRAWKDLPDIINLIIANGMDPDSPDLKEICRKFGPPGVHSEILKRCLGGKNG